MIKPILGLEKILIEYIVVRHMAIITMGNFPM
jgi:hypothetical protein